MVRMLRMAITFYSSSIFILEEIQKKNKTRQIKTFYNKVKNVYIYIDA
jgi:hypothetical protein